MSNDNELTWVEAGVRLIIIISGLALLVYARQHGIF